jgi:hypothetical protein
MMTDSQSRAESVELKRRAAILEQYKAEGRRIDGVKMDSLEPKPSPAYSALKERCRAQEAQIKVMQDVIADQQRMIEALSAACKIYGVAEKIQRARTY